MLEIRERGIETSEEADAVLTLTHAQREKGRLRAETNAGEEARLQLERGRPLRVGERLRSTCGRLVEVRGAPEPVIVAWASNPLTFARGCYHLGNRHVKLEIGEGWLRLEPDHVLEALLTRLGFSTRSETAVFDPEPGAYAHHHAHAR